VAQVSTTVCTPVVAEALQQPVLALGPISPKNDYKPEKTKGTKRVYFLLATQGLTTWSSVEARNKALKERSLPLVETCSSMWSATYLYWWCVSIAAARDLK
jgi:hypothetical protein